MRRCLTMVPFLLLGLSTVAAQKVADAEAKEGFVAMFNGKDLAGWQFDNKYCLPEKVPANWKVEDGVIKLTGGGAPHLGSQWEYDDFDLRLEWRAMKPSYNSGLYLRSGRRPGVNQINLAKGGEGSFTGGKVKGAKGVPKLQKPPMEWNEWRVLAVGDKLSFWCNGELAWEASEFTAKRGHIGLEAEGAPFEFRNLRIKELGFESLNDLKKWTGAEQWKMDADALAGSSSPIETSKKDYKDCIVRLEWKADKGTTGTIGIRGAKADKAGVAIGDLDEGSGGVAGGKPAKKLDNPLGQWNYLEIRVADNKATVWLNGTIVAEGVALTGADAGGISLQPKGPLQFRNLRVKG